MGNPSSERSTNHGLSRSWFSRSNTWPVKHDVFRLLTWFICMTWLLSTQVLLPVWTCSASARHDMNLSGEHHVEKHPGNTLFLSFFRWLGGIIFRYLHRVPHFRRWNEHHALVASTAAKTPATLRLFWRRVPRLSAVSKSSIVSLCSFGALALGMFDRTQRHKAWEAKKSKV